MNYSCKSRLSHALQLAVTALILLPSGFFLNAQAVARPDSLAATAASIPHPELLQFWDDPRKGGCLANMIDRPERYGESVALGLDFLRLTPETWTPDRKDMLVGDVEHYGGLNEADMSRLMTALDRSALAGQKCVLALFRLPGLRPDPKNPVTLLYQDPAYHEQAARFWQDLARRLKGHPAVWAYDILNEPNPSGKDQAIPASRWWKKHKGGPADLNILYRRIVKAIREVDPDTPIILEGYTYGTPEGMTLLEPLDEPGILYSFHFYAPYVFNDPAFNKGRYSYPEAMPGARDGETEAWTIENLRKLMKPAADWCAKWKIPPNRIFVGEFGCQLPVKGIETYLEDVVKCLDDFGCHWSVFAFRSDVCAWFNYEMDAADITVDYWNQVVKGGILPWKLHDTPLWRYLLDEFAAKNPDLQNPVP